MTQYAILIYGNPDATSPEDLAAHDRHAADLIESGALVAAFALTGPEAITTVRDDVVSDGPFVETKEIVAGFGIIEAPDLDAALAIARRNPATWQGGAVEVRPVAGGWIRQDPTAASGAAAGIPAADTR